MSTRALTWQTIAPGCYRGTYAGDGPFRHVLEGRAVRITTGTEAIEQTGEAVPPALEVLDISQDDTARGEQYPPYAVLRWRGRTSAAYYRVKRWDGDEFVTVDIVPENGEGYYRWIGEPVPNVATEQYRVTAVDSEGNESGGMDSNVLIVGVPSRPAQSLAYSNPNVTVTVTAP